MRNPIQHYNSDSEHYNDNYGFDSDRSCDRYSSKLYSYKCNYQSDSDKQKYNGKPKKKVKNIKRTVPVKIHETMIRKHFMKNDVYCLKCATRTASRGMVLLRDNYKNNYRYRLTRICKMCNSKGCKFLKTSAVDSIIKQ